MFGLFKKTTKTESNETLPIDPADLLKALGGEGNICLLYTSPSPRD